MNDPFRVGGLLVPITQGFAWAGRRGPLGPKEGQRLQYQKGEFDGRYRLLAT
jgi:hypothetical protein